MSWRPRIRSLLSLTVINPTVVLIAKTGVSPNLLTVLSLLVGLVAAYLLAQGLFLVGALAVLLSGALDLLDGALARATGKVSPFGALLDSTLDRLTEGAYFFGLLWFYLQGGSAQEVLLIYLVLLGSLMISYVRARSEGLGIQGDVGILARGERVVILALGLLLDWVTLTLWVLVLLILVTFLQRLIYSLRQARNIR